MIVAVNSSYIDGNNGIPFDQDYIVFEHTVGYFFLANFLLMAVGNSILILELRKTNRLQQHYKFDREQCTMFVIYFFFELGGLLRSLNDIILSNGHFKYDYSFVGIIVNEVNVVLIEGLSFLFLLLLHSKSFRL